MNRPGPPATALPDPTIKLEEGWHCLHLYWQVDQKELSALDGDTRARGREELKRIFDPKREGAPQRMQLNVVSGHRADLGIVLMDPDPLVIDDVIQSVRVSPLGPALKPTYSFVSLTEISEYVPTVKQFADRLKAEGVDPASPTYTAKVSAYENRLPMMNQQRLYPDIPPFPVVCFYPMNKIRDPHANWYMEPFSSRSRMMSQHATSGIKFAGRVSQLITASTGFDDWEWGVTLWSRNPESIKEIVYSMRFDEASAKYAEFGAFYIGYVMEPLDAIAHLRL